MAEQKVISITKYHVQKNVAVSPTKEKKELGYYLVADNTVSECYRNTKTIEVASLSEPEKEKLALNQTRLTGRTGTKSTSRFNAKPCGSNCVMFQLLQKGDQYYVRLNCTKTVFKLEGEEIKEFDVK